MGAMNARATASIAALGALLVIPGVAFPYALRGRDLVAFLGDSNTHVAQGMPVFLAPVRHTEIVEAYTSLRFPSLRARFVNRAVPGSKALDVLSRLDGVLAEKPTVIVVVVGILDAIGSQEDPDLMLERYAESLTAIVERASARGIRVFVCSYPVVSNDPAHFAAQPWFLDILAAMAARSREIAVARGASFIDVLGETRAIAAAAGDVGVGDGLHMNDVGNAATGYAILKGLGATQEDNLSAVRIAIDADARVTWQYRTAVRDVAWDPVARRLSFVREDLSLPLALWRLDRRNVVLGVVPFTSALTSYAIAVAGLPAGETYAIRSEGRAVGRASAADLAAGLNLAMASAPPGTEPGGPWDAQALALGAVARVKHISTDTAIRELYRFLPDRNPRVNATPENRALRSRANQARTAAMRLERRLAQPVAYRLEVAP
jgi:hypothetical protein